MRNVERGGRRRGTEMETEAEARDTGGSEERGRAEPRRATARAPRRSRPRAQSPLDASSILDLASCIKNAQQRRMMWRPPRPPHPRHTRHIRLTFALALTRAVCRPRTHPPPSFVLSDAETVRACNLPPSSARASRPALLILIQRRKTCATPPPCSRRRRLPRLPRRAPGHTITSPAPRPRLRPRLRLHSMWPPAALLVVAQVCWFGRKLRWYTPKERAHTTLHCSEHAVGAETLLEIQIGRQCFIIYDFTSNVVS